MGAEAAAGEMLARCWRDAGERLAASPLSVGYFVTVDYSKHTRSILHLVSGHAQAAACLLSAGSSLSAVCRQQLVCCLQAAACLLSAVCEPRGRRGPSPVPGIVWYRCTKAVKILTTAFEK